MSYLKKIYIFLLFLSTALTTTMAQQNNQLYGIVADSLTGEVLIGATIAEISTGRATSTNNYGYYTLPASETITTIQISSMGYNSLTIETDAKKRVQLNIKLVPSVIQLSEATIVGNKLSHASSEKLGKITLSKDKIELLPHFLGEADLMKALQTLPGVTGAREGSSEIVVRGAGVDQNLILLDGAPVYNLNHALGLLSLFNTEIIKDVSLYKGGVPARYGGRASSVVDIVGREGSNKGWKGTAAISTIAVGATLEGPIIKDKASFIISARRSWPDLLMTGALKIIDDGWGFGARFYDINAKFNFQINPKQRVLMSVYSGGDKTFFYSDEGGVKNQYSMGWGNDIASLRWNSIWRSNLYSQCTVYYSGYADNEKMDAVNTKSTRESNFYDLGLNYQIALQINSQQTLKSGFEIGNKSFMPYSFDQQSATQPKAVRANSESQQSAALFVEHETTLDKLTINAGLRYNYNKGKSLTDHSIEPRLSLNYKVDPKLSLKAGVMKSSQTMHALRKSTNGTPTYTWIPATNYIQPQHVWQYSVGAHYNINQNFDVDVEGYYKDIQNTVAGYDVPASAFAELNYDHLLHLGKGKAYGLECLFEGELGKSSVKMAYTLSRSLVKYDAYNKGNWFPSDYDITHNFTTTYCYTIKSTAKNTRNFTALFSVNSGSPLTLPSQVAQNADLPFPTFSNSNYQYTSHPNNAAMPFYHRLDINYQTTHRFKRGYRTWTFGVINLYNQANTYIIVRNSDNQYKKITAFPIMPFISYKTEF